MRQTKEVALNPARNGTKNNRTILKGYRVDCEIENLISIFALEV